MSQPATETTSAAASTASTTTTPHSASPRLQQESGRGHAAQKLTEIKTFLWQSRGRPQES